MFYKATVGVNGLNVLSLMLDTADLRLFSALWQLSRLVIP